MHLFVALLILEISSLRVAAVVTRLLTSMLLPFLDNTHLILSTSVLSEHIRLSIVFWFRSFYTLTLFMFMKFDRLKLF